MVSRRRTTGRRIRTFEERVKLYDEVIRLSLQGLSNSQVSEAIRERFHTNLDPSTITDWVKGGVSPYGRVYRLPADPSPELAYVIGVRFSDGSQSKSSWHHNYKLTLRVNDREFADEFARCAGAVFQRGSFRVSWNRKRAMWRVEVNSIMLYGFLKDSIAKFKPFIEHCNKCISTFLRAFFDGEGSASGGTVSCSNTNLEVLLYVKELLGRFGLKTGRPFQAGFPPGSMKIIKGKIWRVNKQHYVLLLSKQSHKGFASLVGFTIPRKQAQLESRL